MMKQKVLITIERQYGSGGEQIGRLLAQKLNIGFFDNVLLVKASEESNIEEKIFQTFDEIYVNSGLYSIVASSVLVAKGNIGEYKQPPAEQVYWAEFATIRKLAEEQSGIFIGRCSDYILRDYTNAVHIFVHAPIDVRIANVCKNENFKHGDAETIVRKKDKEREKYYNYYTDRRWGDVCNYHLSIDTGKMNLDDATVLIEQYVKHTIKNV